MIFVDTSAWFAAAVTWDANHSAVADWFRCQTNPLLTTDFVIAETLTLGAAHQQHEQ